MDALCESYADVIQMGASIELKKERRQLLVKYREREGEGVEDRQTDRHRRRIRKKGEREGVRGGGG